MSSTKDVTFVIPTFNLKLERMNNLKFILPKIMDTGCKVLIIDQTTDDFSYLEKFVEKIVALHPKFRNLKYLRYISKETKINKSAIVNYGVKQCRTKYVWVNDVDFYMKFSDVLSVKWEEQFIQPYSTGKKLSQAETSAILGEKKIKISYDDSSAEYISLYGALSFIFNRESFLNLGGMDEELIGWGKEDIELNDRISNQYTIQKLELRGIHLWHPVVSLDYNLKISKNGLATDELRDMAIVTCHFNWCKYINPARNLHRFIRQMQVDDIPVYGVELSLTDDFETRGINGWKQILVDKKNVCFQKEACINLAEKFVPKHFTKIAWIDPDLSFTNKNWYLETSKKLDTHKLVQMYSDGFGTNRRGKIIRRHPGIMSLYGVVPMGYWFQHPGHPGGAWGARRELWEHGGLYPYSVMGGGDTVFIYSIFDCDFTKSTYELIGLAGKNIFGPYITWKKSIREYVNKPEDISFISGAFIHEWHGDQDKRNYNLRHEVLGKINMNENIVLNDAGLVEIRNVKLASTYNSILSYFKERDEDGMAGDWQEFLEFKNNKKI